VAAGSYRDNAAIARRTPYHGPPRAEGVAAIGARPSTGRSTPHPMAGVCRARAERSVVKLLNVRGGTRCGLSRRLIVIRAMPACRLSSKQESLVVLPAGSHSLRTRSTRAANRGWDRRHIPETQVRPSFCGVTHWLRTVSQLGISCRHRPPSSEQGELFSFTPVQGWPPRVVEPLDPPGWHAMPRARARVIKKARPWRTGAQNRRCLFSALGESAIARRCRPRLYRSHHGELGPVNC